VEFPEEDRVAAVVPLKWVHTDEDGAVFCWWPPFAGTKRDKAVRMKWEPDYVTWNSFRANLKFESCKFFLVFYLRLSGNHVFAKILASESQSHTECFL
jgi:hypothetical protein